LTYVLKEEDTNIIRGIPQIYNDNRNIKQQIYNYIPVDYFERVNQSFVLVDSTLIL
jgi:hypothetical protein